MITSLSISVIIVNWHSGAYLPRCLDMLLLQTIQDFEVIILDNDSSENEISDFETNKKYIPLNLRVKRLGVNLGFAAANNIGAYLARGKWLVLLNADAFPEPNWLENLVKAAEENPEYVAFSSRQIQYGLPHLLDGTGDAFHISGPAWRHNFNQPAQNFGLEDNEVFSPCAAAAMYLREEFLTAGGFDEYYFSYFEDVDLGFRLRLMGKRCMYVATATVYHVGSGSTGKRSDFSVYHGYRNMIWTYFKNMPSPYFWYFLPLHLLTVGFFVLIISLRGQGKVILRAVCDAFLGLPNILKKRRLIQASMYNKSNDILRVMSTNLLELYNEFVRRKRL